MKVRIGVALGGRTAMPLEQFGAVLDDLELLGFDSVWLPETFLGGTVDPVVGLAYAAARVRRLKLGTHIVTPGRPPYALAKTLAQLDRLSGGRLLLTFVAGLNDRAERAAQGLPTGDRTKWFDEHLPRIRSWWTGDTVDGLTLDTLPQQRPLEVWLGGQATTALDRAGRLADGWLPGAITVADAVAARSVIDATADRHGRAIDREHFGINISYMWEAAPPPGSAPPRTTGDPTDVVAYGDAHLKSIMGRWIEAGFTKIVVRPVAAPPDWATELRRLAATVLHMQT